MRKLIIALVLVLLLAGAGFGWYYLYGPCGVNVVKKSSDELRSLTDEFNDAFDVASNTSRISLSGPIETMQDVLRRSENVELPACLETAQTYTVKSMRSAVDGFITFMGQGDESEVNNKLYTSIEYLIDAGEELDRISACAPFCKPDPYKVIP